MLSGSTRGGGPAGLRVLCSNPPRICRIQVTGGQGQAVVGPVSGAAASSARLASIRAPSGTLVALPKRPGSALPLQTPLQELQDLDKSDSSGDSGRMQPYANQDRSTSYLSIWTKKAQSCDSFKV